MKILILGFGVVASLAQAANLTQINRYATVANKPLPAQINPLLTVQQIHFPHQVETIGDALLYWLQYSGYSLINENARCQALKEVMQQRLPQVDRNLGPMTIQDGLLVIVGQHIFSINIDELHRTVNFKLKKSLHSTQTKGHAA